MLPVGKLYKHEPFLFMAKVYMPDGNGNIKGIYDPLKLAIDFLTHSNDCLFDMYGFNWVPVEPYYSRARKYLDKKLQEEIAASFVNPFQWGC
ncbi:MAG: hypothetical protein ACK5JH_15290 [Anaerocolumna sp.]